MRKMKLIILMTLISLSVIAPPAPFLAILVNEEIRPYEAIIRAIVKVESLGDTLAYNPKEGATGAFQIRQIRLDEFNKLSGENLKLTDCYNYETSKRIFLFYSMQFRPDDYRSIAVDWNKSKTNKYWLKVKKAL